MSAEIKTRQAAEKATSAVPSGQHADTGGVHKGAPNTGPGFNRYIYENLLCHVEGQIECWNRKAARDLSPKAAQALWLKAQGLGYALRLLYVFEPEFRELVECAAQSEASGRA